MLKKKLFPFSRVPFIGLVRLVAHPILFWGTLGAGFSQPLSLGAAERHSASAGTALQELQELSQERFKKPGSAELKQAAQKAITLYSQVLNANKIPFEYKNISGGKKGLCYQAISLLPRTHQPAPITPLSRHILNWKSLLYNIDFVYAPEVLLSGKTDGFMDPQGSFLGLSHDFILEPNRLSPATLHETYHAHTLKEILAGATDLLAGVYRVTHGTFLSPDNTQYYFSFGSLDEIGAHSLTVYLYSLRLQNQLLRRDHSHDLRSLTEEATEDLENLYHSLQITKTLSRQLREVTERVQPLAASRTMDIREIPLHLGDKERLVTAITFSLDAYSREVDPIRPGTYLAPQKGGATWTLYFNIGTTWPLPAEEVPLHALLEVRLEKLHSLAQDVLEQTLEIEKCISVFVEHVNLKTTNLPCVIQKSLDLWNRIESFKPRPYPLDQFSGHNL